MVLVVAALDSRRHPLELGLELEAEFWRQPVDGELERRLLAVLVLLAAVVPHLVRFAPRIVTHHLDNRTRAARLVRDPRPGLERVMRRTAARALGRRAGNRGCRSADGGCGDLVGGVDDALHEDRRRPQQPALDLRKHVALSLLLGRLGSARAREQLPHRALVGGAVNVLCGVERIVEAPCRHTPRLPKSLAEAVLSSLQRRKNLASSPTGVCR